MEEQIVYTIKEKPRQAFEKLEELPLGRYQIIIFNRQFDASCLQGLPYSVADITGSSRYRDGNYASQQDGENGYLIEDGRPRQLQPYEKEMRIFYFQRMDFEGFYPYLVKVAKNTAGFYFRYNKYFAPDVFYFAQLIREEVPKVPIDELYSYIYGNRFDYVYHILG